jgi:hypothetical protein
MFCKELNPLQHKLPTKTHSQKTPQPTHPPERNNINMEVDVDVVI